MAEMISGRLADARQGGESMWRRLTSSSTEHDEDTAEILIDPVRVCDRCNVPPPRMFGLAFDCGHFLCYDCLKAILPRFSPAGGCCTARIVPFGTLVQCAGLPPPNKPKPNRFPVFVKPKSPFDQMYVQGGTLGLASYWFDRDLTKCYIEYDPAACPSWYLEDGQRPPRRKYFEEASYYKPTRTFRGIINWDPVRFHGDSKWTYAIVFNEDFTTIVGGQVKSTGEHSTIHLYGEALRYRLAAGPGAAHRLNNLAIIYAMALSVVSRRRGQRESCSLVLLPIDILRSLKDFLVE